MNFFIGINLNESLIAKTGGQRRYKEAFNCFLPEAVSISTFGGILGALFKKNAKFICFDERYLLLTLPLLLFRREVYFFPRGNKLIHFADSYSKFRLFLYKRIFSLLYSLCYKLTFQTEAQYLEFKDMYNFKGSYSVLPNHIKASWMMDLFQLKAKSYQDGGELVIGFLGGVSSRKGFCLAYESLLPFIKQNKVKMIVAGSSKQELDKYDVEAAGYIENLSDFYSSCDVVLIPSKYDSFPNVFLESLASSTIPLLTRDHITEDICGSNSLLLFSREQDSIREVISNVLDCHHFRTALNIECDKLRTKYDFDWCVAMKDILKSN